jgi:hypothetical protein
LWVKLRDKEGTNLVSASEQLAPAQRRSHSPRLDVVSNWHFAAVQKGQNLDGLTFSSGESRIYHLVTP